MRFSLGYQVVIAILAGIFCGLFFGPLCNVVKPLGDIYIMLLQMVALPYISFSLIHGLGSISPENGKKLFVSGWAYWTALWGIMLALIYLLSLMIPPSAVTFIGTGGQDSALARNFLSYVVPENPFYDLANNVVPAIAVLGLILGIALMHLEKKEPLISLLERGNQIIEKIFKWLAILSPIGIFAHIAVASGTVRFENLVALQFYVFSFLGVSAFVVFWILPAILSSLTPLTYREVLVAFRTVCLLPFATGLPTIALPFINKYMKELGAKHANGDPHFHGMSQTVMPLCYTFGQIGNSLMLFFVLFLSFYYRHPFTESEKTLVTLLSIPMSIGSSATSVNAVTFLIHQLSLPNEAVDLFSQTLALTLNVQVLLSVASVLTLVILVLYSYYGLLEFKWKQIGTHLGLGVFLFAAATLGIKEGIHLEDNYQNRYLDLKISDVIPSPAPAKLLTWQLPPSPRDLKGDVLAQVLESGVLRVGYDPTNIPYCYWNIENELVGYDVAYAYELAKDLDCKIEFVPLVINNLQEEINSGNYDIAMAAILMNEVRLKTMDFTHPYTEQANVLVTRLSNKALFEDLYKAVNTAGIRLGAVGGYRSVRDRHFPLSIAVDGSSIEEDLLQGKADAWVWSKTPGFIWCLSHPQFVVADYGDQIGKRYFAYPIREGSLNWASFLNNWLSLKEQSGFKKRMEQYWIKGEDISTPPPRWSVIQDVLHWGH